MRAWIGLVACHGSIRYSEWGTLNHALEQWNNPEYKIELDLFLRQLVILYESNWQVELTVAVAQIYFLHMYLTKSEAPELGALSQEWIANRSGTRTGRVERLPFNF